MMRPPTPSATRGLAEGATTIGSPVVRTRAVSARQAATAIPLRRAARANRGLGGGATLIGPPAAGGERTPRVGGGDEVDRPREDDRVADGADARGKPASDGDGNSRAKRAAHGEGSPQVERGGHVDVGAFGPHGPAPTATDTGY